MHKLNDKIGVLLQSIFIIMLSSFIIFSNFQSAYSQDLGLQTLEQYTNFTNEVDAVNTGIESNMMATSKSSSEKKDQIRMENLYINLIEDAAKKIAKMTDVDFGMAIDKITPKEMSQSLKVYYETVKAIGCPGVLDQTTFADKFNIYLQNRLKGSSGEVEYEDMSIATVMGNTEKIASVCNQVLQNNNDFKKTLLFIEYVGITRNMTLDDFDYDILNDLQEISVLITGKLPVQDTIAQSFQNKLSTPAKNLLGEATDRVFITEDTKKEFEKIKDNYIFGNQTASNYGSNLVGNPELSDNDKEEIVSTINEIDKNKTPEKYMLLKENENIKNANNVINFFLGACDSATNANAIIKTAIDPGLAQFNQDNKAWKMNFAIKFICDIDTIKLAPFFQGGGDSLYKIAADIVETASEMKNKDVKEKTDSTNTFQANSKVNNGFGINFVVLMQGGPSGTKSPAPKDPYDAVTNIIKNNTTKIINPQAQLNQATLLEKAATINADLTKMTGEFKKLFTDKVLEDKVDEYSKNIETEITDFDSSINSGFEDILLKLKKLSQQIKDSPNCKKR